MIPDIDLSVFVKLADKITGPLKEVEGKVAKASERMTKRLNLSMKLAGGGAAAAGLSYGIKRTVTSFTDSIREVEKAKGELATLGVKNLDVVVNKGREMQMQLAGITADAFVRASYDIKSGISSLTDQGVADMTASAMTVAKATKGNAEQMTSLFATSYGIFKKQMADLTDAEFGERFGAALSASVQQFKTDGAKMQQAIESAGADAVNLGMAMEEQLTLLGMMQRQMQAGEAGTALRAFSSNAAKAHEEFGKLAKTSKNKVVVRVLDENGQLRAMPDILSDLTARYGETLDAFEAAEIKKAFGTDEAMKLINALYGQEAAIRANAEALEGAADKGNEFTSAMAKAADNNWDSAMVLMSQRMDVLKQKIGDRLLPVVERFIPIFDAFTQKAFDWIDANPELVTAIGAVVAGIGAIAAIAAPVLLALAGLNAAWAVGAFWTARVAWGIGGVFRAFGALGKVKPLKWAALVPRLAWRAFVAPLKWAALAGKLGWRALISPLRWGLRFIPVIGWAALAGTLAWSLLIKPMGWDKYLPKIDWARVWGAFSWDGWLPELDWGKLISAVSWPEWLGSFDWADWLSPLVWNSWIGPLDISKWFDFAWADVLPNWDWGAIIPDIPDLKAMFGDAGESIDVRLENRTSNMVGQQWQEGAELVQKYRDGLVDLEQVKARLAEVAGGGGYLWDGLAVNRAQDMLALLQELEAAQQSAAAAPAPEVADPQTLLEASRAASELESAFPRITAAVNEVLTSVRAVIGQITALLQATDYTAEGARLALSIANGIRSQKSAVHAAAAEIAATIRAALPTGAKFNVSVTGGGKGPKVQARARGGSFGPGWLLTGEEGPELEYKNRGGYIAHNRALQAMARLSQRIRGSMAGGMDWMQNGMDAGAEALGIVPPMQAVAAAGAAPRLGPVTFAPTYKMPMQSLAGMDIAEIRKALREMMEEHAQKAQADLRGLLHDHEF